MGQMGQKSRISAVLAVFTDGANLKKWGQIWKIGANFADFWAFLPWAPVDCFLLTFCGGVVWSEYGKSEKIFIRWNGPDLWRRRSPGRSRRCLCAPAVWQVWKGLRFAPPCLRWDSLTPWRPGPSWDKKTGLIRRHGIKEKPRAGACCLLCGRSAMLFSNLLTWWIYRRLGFYFCGVFLLGPWRRPCVWLIQCQICMLLSFCDPFFIVHIYNNTKPATSQAKNNKNNNNNNNNTRQGRRRLI